MLRTGIFHIVVSIPAASLDFASLSFQVPMFRFSAKLAANPTKHRNIVIAIDLAFIFLQFEKECDWLRRGKSQSGFLD